MHLLPKANTAPRKQPQTPDCYPHSNSTNSRAKTTKTALPVHPSKHSQPQQNNHADGNKILHRWELHILPSP